MSALISGPNQLQKRTLDLQHNDFTITVTLLGTMATLSWEPKQLVLFYGCVKREYNGRTTLETTRLAWRLINPPWLDALALAEDSQPARKALRRESHQPTTIHSLSPDNTCQAVIYIIVTDTIIFLQSIIVHDNAHLYPTLMFWPDKLLFRPLFVQDDWICRLRYQRPENGWQNAADNYPLVICHIAIENGHL